MTRMEDALEQALKECLRPERSPSTEETWQLVQDAIRMEPQHRRKHTLVRVILGLAALFLIAVISVGAAMATSPDFRDYLAGWVNIVGGQIKEGRLVSLHPAPPFVVLQPTDLPTEFRLVTLAYRPGPVGIGPIALLPPEQVIAFSRIDGREVSPEIANATRTRAQLHLHESREPMLVLVYAIAPDQTLELIQRSHNGKSLPSGESTWLRGLPAVFVNRDGRDVITWVEKGTLVELHTSLERSETLRIATALEATPLTPFDTTGGGPHFPVSQLTPTSIARSQRVDALVIPQADPELIRQRCGPWNGNSGSLEEISEQARCVARVASGVDEIKGNSGISRRTWHEEAKRLSLDPSQGPSGDPIIWSVQFAISGDKSYVVVLDAITGQPYLVVRLSQMP